MALTRRHSAIIGTAGNSPTDGYEGLIFVCRDSINFVANDNDAYPMLFNFDSPVGNPGTQRLYPGEVVSDIPMPCEYIYVRGEGGPVPFRAYGV